MAPARTRRTELLLFVAAFLSFAYFQPGGGWNQNGRFAQIRAVVEQGAFAIDSFFVYRVDRGAASGRRLGRVPVENGEVVIEGERYALAWPDASGGRIRLAPGSTAKPISLTALAVSGDVTFVGGHLYPNKAPGLTFLSVPAYFAIHRIGTWLGEDPDDWWALTRNAWLTNALSVGLLAALGTVIFFRGARALVDTGETAAVFATAAFTWGTLFFPYGTMLYEHDPMAVALLASFVALLRAADRPAGMALPMLAGLAAGAAVVANYIALPVVGLLGAYALWRLGLRGALALVAGFVPPIVMLGLYDLACFGAPWSMSYGSNNPLFQSHDLFLGVFDGLRPGVLVALLVSPFRGLFYTSPVLLAGAAGGIALLRDTRRRGEVLLCFSVVAFFLAFNACFHNWESGWAPGPRYLIPAIPFLALPSVLAFDRMPRPTSLLALVSIAVMTLVTAVDPQAPVLLGEPLWRSNPILEYELPLFLNDPAPIVAAETRSTLFVEARAIAATGAPEPDRVRALTRVAESLAEAARRNDVHVFPAATRRGPVSANPAGFYEPGQFTLADPGTEIARWNACNAGELLWPESRWSLAPVVFACAALVLAAAVHRT